MKENKLPQEDLTHGAYYSGHCERLSAQIARWDGTRRKFVVMELSCGFLVPQRVAHVEDDDGHYEIFTPVRETSAPAQEIPLNW